MLLIDVTSKVPAVESASTDDAATAASAQKNAAEALRAKPPGTFTAVHCLSQTGVTSRGPAKVDT